MCSEIKAVINYVESTVHTPKKFEKNIGLIYIENEVVSKQ
jgi:hypothetical protein